MIEGGSNEVMITSIDTPNTQQKSRYYDLQKGNGLFHELCRAQHGVFG